MAEWEPWRDKLPQKVIDGIDAFRQKRENTKEVMSMTRVITSPHLTIDVPTGLMYKTVKITMTLEGDK
jgi:hypothetical protein